MMGYPGMKRPYKRKTLYVNLFGGPGAGKSTGAAYVFSRLKVLGVNCEYVSEYAKHLVWLQEEGSLHPNFKSQLYIFAKQHMKMITLEGKVDVVITDAPLKLSSIYGINESPSFHSLVSEEVDKMNNLNVFIERKKEYNSKGRMQTLEEAKEIDSLCSKLEMDLSIPGTLGGYHLLIDSITNY